MKGEEGGVMSAHDETHLGMNASPFISLFSSVHSQRLMERCDKRGGGGPEGVGVVKANLYGRSMRGGEWRNEADEETNGRSLRRKVKGRTARETIAGRRDESHNEKKNG